MKLTHRLPKKYWVACSGGIDSMAVLNFINTRSNRPNFLGVVHLNHNTEFGHKAERFVLNYCQTNDIKFYSSKLYNEPPKGESKENWWRDQRYAFFDSVPGDDSIILAHQLDDCLEEYLACVLIKGYQSTIPYQHGRCIRPFRLWKRSEIQEYVKKYNVPYIEDPSNKNIRYRRNRIRHTIVPSVIDLNHGVYKIVKRLIEGEKSESN